METDQIQKKAVTASSPIRTNTTPPGPWAKSDDEKAKPFADYLAEVYTPPLTPPTQTETACSPTTPNAVSNLDSSKPQNYTELSKHYPQPRRQTRIKLQRK
jgi:hypothetical protein